MKATRSILPNSDDRILVPLVGKHGTFQVSWVADIDSHVLIYSRAVDHETIVCGHHNGYSCHELGKRILMAWDGNKDGQEHALRQLDYISECGGFSRNREHVRNIIAGEG